MTPAEPYLRPLRTAGAVIAILCGVWAGLRVYSSQQAAHATHGNLALKVPAGEASPPSGSDFGPALDTQAIPPAKIPDRLPDFSLSDRSGNATAISKWSGKALILNFWATWCAPCRREIPLLKSLANEWSERGVEVVGVAVDYPDKVNAYADELKIRYPILLGEQDALDVAAQLGVDTPVFPFTVFTDRRGEVVALYVGELHRPQADLILGVVERLNDGQVQVPEARRSIAAGLQALAAG